MRRRRLASFAALALAGVGAWAGVSYSSGSGPEVPADLDASRLPTTGLPPDDREAVERALVIGVADGLGISAQSFDRARKLADTAAGTIYVVPGELGLCLVRKQAVACGGPGTASEAPVSTFALSKAGFLVGGGILPAGAKQVELVLSDGSRVAPKSVPGGFVIDESFKIRPQELATIEPVQDQDQ